MPNRLKDQIKLQQEDSHTYTVGDDPEWQMGSIILGGCVTAAIFAVAEAHFTSTLSALSQPDVHTLHIEFFRPCAVGGSTIKVTDLKVGKGSSCIQLSLYQSGSQLRCTALATSTNFSANQGPSAPSAATLSPPVSPIPDFGALDTHRPDPNWIPSKTITDLLPVLKHMTFVYHTAGQTLPGIIDYWLKFDEPESFTSTHLALLSDLCPSPSDTLLRTNGVWDAHRGYRIKKAWSETNPGVPALIAPTIKEASKAPFWNTTATMDLQFKRRVTDDDRWTFTRATTRMLHGGRMDLSLDVFDRNLDVLCLIRQVMLVADVGKRFKKEGEREKKAAKI